MSHAFTVRRNFDGLEATFHGYANGIFYKCFGCEDFDKGVSGSNEERVFKKQFVQNALLKALSSSEIRTYPDKNRAKELANFLANEMTYCVDSDEFTVCFW